MHWFRRLKWRIEVIVRKEALEADLDRELRSHLEAEVRANVQTGLSPAAARRKAMVEFGGLEQVKEEVREARGGRPLDDFLQDLRYAFRGLRKRPVFSAAAILTLALGIGASTAMFTVVKVVLLNPLPYENPDELVMIWQELRARNVLNWTASPPELEDYRQLDSYRELAGATPMSLTLTGGDRPEQIRAAVVSHNFFRVFSADFFLGRPFVEEDVSRLLAPPDPGAEPPALAAILTHGIWQRQYGGDPDLVGGTIRVGVRPMTVVGILSRDFDLLLPDAALISRDVEVFVASPFPPNAPRRNVGIRVIGRLKTGVTPDQAQAEMDAHWSRMRAEVQLYADTDHYGHVVPLKEDLVRGVRPMILVLFASVVLVLLIACANVSSLLLVRATARSGEMSVRAALGGSRGRLVRQMLSEGLVLAAVGLSLGVLLAQASLSLLSATRPVELPRMETLGLDGTGLGFSLLVSVAAVLLFALFPALQGSRTDLARTLQGRSGGDASPRRGGLRSGLVVAEVALSLVLLIGAGLMVRSTFALARVDVGFDPENVLTFVAAPPSTSFRSRDERVSFVLELQERISALPGVTRASAAGAVPFTSSMGGIGRAGPEQALVDESVNQQARYTYVFPGYFETMEIRLLEGRLFTPEEYVDSIPVVVVDHLLAQAIWPGESAVGKTLVSRPGGSDPTPQEVVGVVEHQMAESLKEAGEDMFYYPVAYYGSRVNPNNITWTVRTAVPPESLVPLIRREVQAVKADAPLSRVRTLESYLDAARAPTRFALSLIAFFALSSLILSVVGLYGVLAYGVQQRTAEIGVRLAFGAEPGRILSMVLGKGVRLVLIGLGLGTAGALLLTRFMASLLVGTPTTDPFTFLGVGVLFTGVAVLACYLPARRATKVDPVRAIQAE